MHTRTSLALRALRGARWAPAVGCGAVAAPLASIAGGPAAVTPAVAAVILAVALASVLRGPGHTAGLTGIARAWAREHPWRFTAGPAAGVTAALLVLDAATGGAPVGAVLAGLAVLAVPRVAVVRPSRTHVPAAAALTGRRLRALPQPEPALRVRA